MTTTETGKSQPDDRCAECGAWLESPRDLIEGRDPPCPACGCASAIRSGDEAEDPPGPLAGFRLTYRSTEKYKGTSGTKRHNYEQQVDLRASHDGVRRSRRTTWRRTPDFTRGWYEEIVTEEATGAVHYYNREWIAFHRERGTAKRQTFWTAYDWALDSIAPVERPTRS